MKGLSEITSAVIVLAVGVGLVSLYAQWAPGFTEDTVEAFTNQSNQKIRCNNAALSIDNTLYDRTGEILEFDLENTGTIRFSQGLYAGAFSSSLELNRTVVSELGVGETQNIRINTDRAPDMILVTSKGCPDVEARETEIKVQK